MFTPEEAAILVEQYRNSNYNQYSYLIIQKVLETKQYPVDEQVVVQVLMERMSSILQQFDCTVAEEAAILQLSNGLYSLLLRVEYTIVEK